MTHQDHDITQRKTKSEICSGSKQVAWQPTTFGVLLQKNLRETTLLSWMWWVCQWLHQLHFASSHHWERNICKQSQRQQTRWRHLQIWMMMRACPSAWALDFMKESKEFVKQAVAIWSQQTLCHLNPWCLMLQSHQMMETTSGPKLLWTTFLGAYKHVLTFAFKLLKYQDKWRNNMKHILLNVVLCLSWLLNTVLLFVSFRFLQYLMSHDH